jgi:hypothetical protein
MWLSRWEGRTTNDSLERQEALVRAEAWTQARLHLY